MKRLIRTSRSVFKRTLTWLSLVLFVVLGLITVSNLNQKVAQAATNNTINFQARILTAQGNLVPDGSYNVEFKIYDASSGGTNLWTESWTGANKITAKNGYVTASLGSVHAFDNHIPNWGQQLYLTLNIGGTGAPGWDGEMNPRMQITAVPYAMGASKLAVDNGTYSTSLTFADPTVGNQSFTLPDLAAATSATIITTGNLASITGVGTVTSGTWHAGVIGATYGGTGLSSYVIGDLLYANSTTTLTSLAAGADNYCLTSQGAGVAPNWEACAAGGTGSYIQNQYTAAQTSSSFWISGTGRADTSFVAPLFIGINAAGGSNGNGGNITISAGAKDGSGTAGSVIIKPQASNDSATAFQVQNGAGTSVILNVDTTSKFVGINTATPSSALHVVGTSSVATVSGSNLITADGGFDSTTNWTGTGAGSWNVGSSVATHVSTSTTTLSGTSTATDTNTMYQINFTTTVTTAGDGFRISLGGTDSGNLITTAGAQTVYIRPGAGTGTLNFNPGVAGTFVGTIDSVTINAISASTPNVLVVGSDGTSSPLEIRSGGSGLWNSFIGTYVGSLDTSGYGNSAAGYSSLQRNTSGYYNSAMGMQSLQLNTSGYYNSALGYQSLQANTTGYQNTAVGALSLAANTYGMYNTAVGYKSSQSNTGGTNNTAVGYYSLQANSTGGSNTALGWDSLYWNTTGSNNTAIGTLSGRYIADGASANQTSSNSIYLGYSTKALANGDTNEIVIGYNAVGVGNNSVVLGNNATTTIQLGNSQTSGNTAGSNIAINGAGGYGTGAGGNITLQAGNGGNTGAGGAGGITYLYGGNAGATNANGGNVVISAGTKAGSGTAGSVIIKPQASNDSTTAFQVQNGAGSSVILNVDTTNKYVGINTNAPSSALHVVGTNSVATVVSASNLLTADGGFDSTTNWTGTGAGSWNVGSSVATHVSTDTTVLSGTSTATSTTTMYQINFTTTVTTAGDGFTVSLGGTDSGNTITTAGAQTVYIKPGAGTGSLNFTPGAAGTFVGTIDSVTIYAINGSTADITVASSNGTSTLLEVRVGGSALGNVFVGRYVGQSDTTGISNSAMGYSAFVWNTTGSYNSAMGYGSLNSNTTGSNNSAMGYSSLQSNTTGSNNTAMGYESLQSNTTASNNTAIGRTALQINTTGYSNTAVGFTSLRNNTTGYNNSAIGDSSLSTNSTGYNNTALGYYSLQSNTTGYQNTAIGSNSLLNSTGSDNSAMGRSSLQNTTGSSNTAFGSSAGRTLTTGSSNTFIGYFAGYDGSQKVDATNSMALGNGSYTTASNQVVIGNANITQIQLGTAPTSGNTAGANISLNTPAGYGTGAGGNLTLQAGSGGSTGAGGAGGITYLYGGNAGATNANGGNIVISAGTKAGSGTAGSVIIKPQASNDSTTAFQVQNGAGSSVILNVDTTNKYVGINTATPSSALHVVGTNSVATVVSASNLITADGGFDASTNWTVGAGWTIGSSVVTHATGNTAVLSGTSTATTTTTMYQINFTTTVTTAGDGFTVSLGGTDSGNTITTAGTKTVYVKPGAGTGTLSFTPGAAGTFVGTIDTVTIYAITSSKADITVVSSDGTGSPLEVRAGGNFLANSFIGTNVGRLNTSGSFNSAVGWDALQSNTTGTNNSAVGASSLQYNTTGGNNSALGVNSLMSNTTGNGNSAVGNLSLQYNTTGSYNSAVGNQSLQFNTTGNYNLALGSTSLQFNTTGSSNVAVGLESLYSNITGSYNSAVGVGSLYNSTGGYSIALGYNAGRFIADGATANQTSNNSVYLGYGTRALANGDTNEIILGYQTIGSGSNSVTLGNSSITKIQLGNSQTSGNTAGSNITVNGAGGYGTGAGGNLTLQAGSGGSTGAGGAGGITYLYGGNAGATNANGGNIVISAGTKAGSGTAGSVIIKPQASNDSTTAFQVQNGAGTSVILNVDTTNNFVGINNTTPGAALHVIGTNSVALVDSATNRLGTTDGGFDSSTGWTVGAGWAIGSSVVTHSTGNTAVLSGATNATNTFIVYQVNFTTTVTTAGDGFTVSLGGSDSGSIITTAGAKTIYIKPGAGTGTLSFTPGPAGTFEGTIDGVTVYQINVSTPDFKVTSSNGNSGQLEVRAGGTGQENSFMGGASGQYITTGIQDSAFGSQTLQYNTTGTSNSAFGAYALRYNTSGSSNTAIGREALGANITGYSNTAVGSLSLKSNTTGYTNTAIGQNSLQANTTGYQNTALGYNSLFANTTGKSNVAIGYAALGALTSGNNNTATGQSALEKSQTGYSNVAYGNLTLYNNLTGYSNTAIGYGSGFNNNASANVFLGYSAGYYETASNTLMIDNAQRANEADARTKALIYGQFASTVANQQLTVNGSLNVTGSQFTNGGATLNTAKNYASDYPTGGAIDAAATSVDVYTYITISGQTTTNQTLTLPNPTSATAGRLIYITNKSAVSYTMYGIVSAPGTTQDYVWSGAAWTVNGSGTTGNYIQNQNAAQQAASNFWISGGGQIDGTLKVATIDTASAVALNIGATATSINLQKATNIAGDLSFSSGGNRNISVNANAGGAGYGLTVSAGNAGSGNTNGGDLTLVAGAKSGSGTIGKVIIKPQSGNESTTAFQVQNGAGSSVIFNVDTISKYVGINTAAPSSALHVVGTNSVATVGVTNLLTADGGFDASTNWTVGAGWTIGSSVATHATGNTAILSGTSTATVTQTVYQINFTTTVTTAGDGFTVSLGGTDSGNVITTAGAQTVYIRPGAGTGILNFTPGVAGTFVGTIDSVTIYAISNSTADISVISSNGTSSPLQIRAGGSGQFNSFIGAYAGMLNTSGNYNSAVGYGALMWNTTGSLNSALGYDSLNNNTSGSNNTAIGYTTLQFNTTGSSNTAMGRAALQDNTTGNGNTAIGNAALVNNTTGSSNVALGSTALQENTIGVNNAAIGYQALQNNVIGNSNAAIGTGALQVSTGSANTALGTSAGASLTTGNTNTFIGNSAGNGGSQKVDAANSMALGYNSYTTANNQVVIGNTSVTQTLLNGSVGINTNMSAPTANTTLDVQGTFTTGNLLQLKARGATTLTAALNGSNIDLSSYNSGTNNVNVTGENITLGLTAGTTNTATSGTTYMNGIQVTGNPITQNGAGGTTQWSGVNVTMPTITQTAGTMKAYGLFVKANTMPSGTSTGLYFDTSAANFTNQIDGSGHYFVVGNTGNTTIAPTANNAIALSVTGTTGTAASALKVIQGGTADAVNVAINSTGFGIDIVSGNAGSTGLYFNQGTAFTNLINTSTGNFLVTNAGAGTLATSLTTPIVYGSSSASGTLTLNGTSDATTGTIALNSSGGGVVIGNTAANRSANTNFDIQGTFLSGNIFQIKGKNAITINGVLNGSNIDLSNYTSTNYNVNGENITLGLTAGTTNTNAAGTTSMNGIQIIGNPVTQNGAGTTQWSGVNVTIPTITQSAGTMRANGLTVNSGTLTSGTSNGIYFNGNTFSNLLQTSTGVFTVANSGATTHQLTNASALLVQSAAGADTMFTVDTTNNRVKVGNDTAAAGANTTALVLDTSTTANRPTGVVGAMYYDTTLGHIQCYESAAWGDCGNTTLQNAYNNSTASPTPEIIVDSTRFGVDIQDKTGGTIGATYGLFNVRGVGTASTLGASLFTVNASGKIAINNGSTLPNPTINYDLSFGSGAGRTIGVEAPVNAAGNTLTVSAGNGGTGAAANIGGALYLNGGTANGTGNANGGIVSLQGGAPLGTGAYGDIYLNQTGGRVCIGGNAGTCTFDAINPEKLLVDAGVTTSVNALGVYGSIDNYLQINIKNRSAGANASTDISATANNGDENTNYVDMGINGSNYTGGIVGNANDAYLYSTGQNLLIGNGTAGKDIIFFTGGANAYSNQRLRLTDAGLIGLNLGAQSIVAGIDLQFGGGANRVIQILQSTAAGAGRDLTIKAGQGNAGAGGNLLLQGGNGQGTNQNGGSITLSGGIQTGSGTPGVVNINTPVFTAITAGAGAGNCAADCTISQTYIDGNSTVIVNASVAGIDITLPDPTNSTGGRIVYITTANGSLDFNLVANGGGSLLNIAMRQNTTATMIWNGTDWTAAGASSSTTLQSAYDATMTSAGGAEIVLNNTASSNGLTVRNNEITPILGGILEIQTAIGSNLLSVNNNATEYAKNGGAETMGGTTTTFPATTWGAAPAGGTVTRYITPGDYIATGAASVSVVTTTTSHGADNQLSIALTPNLKYTVSYAVRGTTSFSTLDTIYSRDGTNTTTTTCKTGSTVTTGIWTRVSCTFTAPSSGITAANGIFIRQSDATGRTFYIDNLSVTVSADVNHAADGSADDVANFATNWTAYGAGATANRDISTIYDTSASARADTAAATDRGIRNNLAITPQTNTQYLVTMYARSSIAMSGTDFLVRYSRDGGTSFAQCTDYSTQALSTTLWTKITCLFKTDGTVATNPDLIMTQSTSATAKSIYIDALSVTLSTNTSSNVQIGGGNQGGPTTLFTLDRSASAPIAANNDSYLGSMYYDTTSGKIQCYESDGWGACGSAPDNIVNLNPEFAGAVLNGPGVGTMTADFCGNGGGLSVNTGLCASGEARNFYKWTSPQSTQQTYSIYVTYQLPASFKAFADDNTVQLTARRDSSNAAVTYEMYRSEGGTITQCGAGETAATTRDGYWDPSWINGNEATGCGFTTSSANAFVIFKINLKAQSNASAYVGTLTFTTTGR